MFKFRVTTGSNMSETPALAKEILDAHNKYRAQHGCPPLVLDSGMSKFATEWAQTLARSNKFEHRPNNKYGENVFMMSGQAASGQAVVKAWYDEIKNYNFSKPGHISGTGHFTQVIWKETKNLGIGIATKEKSTWVVANYDPPGNINTPKDYKDNVPPAKGK